MLRGRINRKTKIQHLSFICRRIIDEKVYFAAIILNRSMLCENHIYTVNGNSEITVTVINGNKYVTLVDNLMWHIMSCTLLKS